MTSIRFERAEPNDAALLTETAFASKSIWNYPEKLMNLWTDELTLTTSYIKQHKVFKIFGEQGYLGFFSLVAYNQFIEIDHFWLLPKNIGKGYGRRAFDFIIETVKDNGYNAIEVCADPNTNGFYAKMGGKVILKKESKIKGRFLNIYEFTI